MRRRGIQLSQHHKLWFYSVSVVLFASGAAWAWANQFDDAGRIGDTLRLMKTWLLKAHGFAALGFVLLLGTLLPGHVRRAWQAGKNRVNGAFFLTAVSLLTLSGYALYYLGDESWRNATIRFHQWLGFAAPVLLIWHLRVGREATRK